MTLAIEQQLSRPASAFSARLPLCVALVCGLACLAFIPGPAGFLQYDRAALATGELWRVLTGHLTHWSRDHLAWDVVTFAALGVLAERRDRRRFLACVLASSVLISAAVWVLRPDLTYYRGLSGIDSALFVLVATTLLGDARASLDRIITLVAAGGLAAFAIKTIWELASGTALFVNPSAAFEPLPLAHLVGGAAGLLTALSPSLFTHDSNPQFKERAS